MMKSYSLGYGKNTLCGASEVHKVIVEPTEGDPFTIDFLEISSIYPDKFSRKNLGRRIWYSSVKAWNILLPDSR
jgi:hypothetical protein